MVNKNINMSYHKMKRHKIEDWIFIKIPTVLIWVLGIIAIYWIFLKLTNHSPTFEQVGVVILGIVGSLVFKHNGQIGELKQFKDYSEKEFVRVNTKLDKIDNELGNVKLDITSLKSDMSNIKSDISFIKSRV